MSGLTPPNPDATDSLVSARVRHPRRRLPGPLVATVASVAGWLLLWQVASALEVVPPLFLPPPSAVFGKLVSVASTGFVEGTLLQHAAASLGRVASALLVTVATAVPVGVGLALSPVFRGALDPVIEFYRPIPPLAYLPLIIIWLNERLRRGGGEARAWRHGSRL